MRKRMKWHPRLNRLRGREATSCLFDIRRFRQFSLIERFELVFETLNIDRPFKGCITNMI